MSLPRERIRFALAAALTVLGLLQMAGALFGIPALQALGAATLASPAPKVFTTSRGLESFSSRFVLHWREADGTPRELAITPQVSARLRGPYNRRNVYGALLAFGPVLTANTETRPMFAEAARFALCGDAPLLRELGIEPGNAFEVRVRVESRSGAYPADLPSEVTAPCPCPTVGLADGTARGARFSVSTSSATLPHCSRGHPNSSLPAACSPTPP